MLRKYGKICVKCEGKYAGRGIDEFFGPTCDICSDKGIVVQCYWCHAVLAFDQFEVDRHPVCGHNGGKYVHENIVPACRTCNVIRCNINDAVCQYGEAS